MADRVAVVALCWFVLWTRILFGIVGDLYMALHLAGADR
jgi:hypothetical protein